MLKTRIVFALFFFTTVTQFLFVQNWASEQVNDIAFFVCFLSAYLLACARSLNVPPIDPSKVRKMFTNKCTTAKAKRKKQLLSLK